MPVRGLRRWPTFAGWWARRCGGYLINLMSMTRREVFQSTCASGACLMFVVPAVFYPPYPKLGDAHTTECNESALEAAARSRKTCALSSASAGRVKPAMQRSHLQHCIMNRLGVSAVTADVTVS